MNFHQLIKRFGENKNGATAIEYGLITAMISVVIIASLTIMGTELNNTFGFIASTLSN